MRKRIVGTFLGKDDIKLRKELEHVKAACLWKHHYITLFLKFVGPCIANIFAEDNQKFATFHNLFISYEALHVSGDFPVHHQELNTAHTASGICQNVTATCC